MSSPSSSTLLVQRMDDVRIIEFTDTAILDQGRIEQIHQELLAIVAVGVPKIILSFENVQHISSAMLGVLMSLHKQIKAAGGEMRLAAISKNIAEVFKLTKLDKMLKIYRSTDQAMVKF
jgi:anti-sigma B factor antagonist